MWPARGPAETRWQCPIRSVPSTLSAEPYQIQLEIQLLPQLQQKKWNISLRVTLQQPILAGIKMLYFTGFCCVKAYNTVYRPSHCSSRSLDGLHKSLIFYVTGTFSVFKNRFVCFWAPTCVWQFKGLSKIRAVRRAFLSASVVKHQDFNKFSFKG